MIYSRKSQTGLHGKQGFPLLILIILLFTATPALANKKYASLVMDADTGAILHQRYADKMLHPASLTKIMTLLMLFEELDAGRIRMNDRIPISRNAASMVPSKLNLPAGSSIRVEDAIYSLVTKSANDIAVAIAEKIGKTESRFAVMMTKKARELGMNRTRFMNASGLHHPRQVTTARDMAKMGRYLIALQPRNYRYFATKNFSYRGKTYRNHNHLLGKYEGMDGIKTGYIQAAGFNLLASAKRGDKRLIGVVFGGRTSRTRNAHMREILDAGFRKVDTVRHASTLLPKRNPRRIAMAQAASFNKEPISASASSSHPSQLTKDLLAAQSNRLGRYQKTNQRKQIAQTTIAQHKEILKTQNYAQTFMKPQGSMHGLQNASLSSAKGVSNNPKAWSIQVGAFSDRNATDQTLMRAYKKLPTALQYATPQVAPLQKGNKNWIYRAWLTGFSQKDAQAACVYYKDCLVIEPQTN